MGSPWHSVYGSGGSATPLQSAAGSKPFPFGNPSVSTLSAVLSSGSDLFDISIYDGRKYLRGGHFRRSRSPSRSPRSRVQVSCIFPTATFPCLFLVFVILAYVTCCCGVVARAIFVTRSPLQSALRVLVVGSGSLGMRVRDQLLERDGPIHLHRFCKRPPRRMASAAWAGWNGRRSQSA
jgi:hypothetical protein